jgi:hypothetical protein
MNSGLFGLAMGMGFWPDEVKVQVVPATSIATSTVLRFDCD